LVTVTIPAPADEIPSKWLSYPGPPRANVLLPAGYDPHVRYPLLVLLNGLDTNYAWFAQWGLTTPLASLDAIVVMPEGGSGWYTDWWNDGGRGAPSWESYELNTVLPFVLARYPILPERRYHAIAGVSMGGLGAMYLGGRLPGFFGSVASLSGFVDPEFFAPVTQVAMGVTSLAPFKGDEYLDPVDGPPTGFYFKGHDPALLPTNLKQTRVFESTGTGAPSTVAPFNEPGSSAEAAIIYPMNQAYHRTLVAAGVNVTYQVHPGGHDIPDFITEVEAMVAWGPFSPVPTAPASWVNDTVATTGQLWDIGYHFSKPTSQVVRFQHAGATLSITAAGSDVTITTSGACAIHTRTPATIDIPTGRCR
jgi:S-formylglutathione hydrolase FrmB